MECPQFLRNEYTEEILRRDVKMLSGGSFAGKTLCDYYKLGYPGTNKFIEIRRLL